ncbi:MAG: hypothetical protein AAGL17_26125, partial [Cyanobacteria bacterium J06576_12]
NESTLSSKKYFTSIREDLTSVARLVKMRHFWKNSATLVKSSRIDVKYFFDESVDSLKMSKSQIS